jgi:hypothetical protein
MIMLTKKCVGKICEERTAEPSYIEDDQTYCDRCLLYSYMPDPWGTYDSYDHDGVGDELYTYDDVVKGLRKASGE